MKVTLRDVAKKAGLSITTVSRALNGYDDVAPETKQAIFVAAAELGYTPNLNARRLKTRRADAIGLVLPNESLRFSDPFFSDLLSGIVEQSAQHGLELNVTTPLDSDKVEDIYLKYVRSHRVDGFILVRVRRNDARIRLLQKLDFPFVAFGRTDSNLNYPFIDEDGDRGIQEVIDYLVTLGHRRIACITEPLYLSKSYARLQGYRKGLAAHGITPDPKLIVESNFRQRSGRQAAQKLLSLAEPPTAIVAVNDLLALGAMGAAHERGLRIGRDISITGFDNIILSEYANPPLTTLHQPAYDMGVLLCEMLISVIQGADRTELQRIFQPQLVVRQSTGPAPA